jgi:hypothetical protein
VDFSTVQNTEIASFLGRLGQGLDPALVWGLLPRFVGFIHMLAFASFALQAEHMMGSNGVMPLAPRLVQIKRDFPGLRRFFEYPTVFWLDCSDRAVRLVPWLGFVCGFIAILGGTPGYMALACAWLLWLSIEPAGCIFPWDTMLYELAFLVLFLPVVPFLPELAASTLPWPSVAFMFRWFVLRLMLGFGKVKFLAANKEDKLYLHGFFIWMPSPTRLGWHGHHLPHFVLRQMLYFMFVAEVIAPVLGFFSGPLRVVSFAFLVALMAGIQVTGNWGFFNIGYVLLCLCLLDVNASVFDLGSEPWWTALHTPEGIALHALLGLMFLTGIVQLVIGDSWIGRTFMHWPFDSLVWNRAWARGLLKYLRAVSPLRLVNGYGVFPPHSGPPFRIVPVYEGSNDGEHWSAYRYKFYPSSPFEPPPFVSPHHPRIDMALFYAAVGTHDAGFYGSLLGDGTPYACWAPSSWLDRLGQLLLKGEPRILKALAHNPFPDQPPKYVRASAVAVSPTTKEEYRSTGAYWRTRRIGTIVEAREREQALFDIAQPEPEQFHPDWLGYKRRSAPLKAITAAHARGLPADQAAIVDSDLRADEVETFWSEVVPFMAEARGDYARLEQCALGLRARYGRVAVNRFERLLERFAWLLRMRTERHHFADATPKIPLESNFRYSMLLHEIVLDGRAAYQAVLDDPGLAAARAPQTSDESQLWALSVLRYDLMLAHIRSFRWYLIGKDCYDLKVPGIFEYYPLMSAYKPPDEVYLPKFIKHPSGAHGIEGFYPDYEQKPIEAVAERSES